jgi:hypothetical protein
VFDPVTHGVASSPSASPLSVADCNVWPQVVLVCAEAETQLAKINIASSFRIG